MRAGALSIDFAFPLGYGGEYVTDQTLGDIPVFGNRQKLYAPFLKLFPDVSEITDIPGKPVNLVNYHRIRRDLFYRLQELLEGRSVHGSGAFPVVDKHPFDLIIVHLCVIHACALLIVYREPLFRLFFSGNSNVEVATTHSDPISIMTYSELQIHPNSYYAFLYPLLRIVQKGFFRKSRKSLP